MNAVTAVLALVLGSGGLGGLLALLRLRVDRGATVVETVSKGVLVLERINDRLEGDLSAERAGRIAAETERDALRRQLDACRCRTPGG